MTLITAREHNVKNVMNMFPPAMLRQLAEKTPLDVEEMATKIDNLPRHKIEKYGGDRFLRVTTKYYCMIASK